MVSYFKTQWWRFLVGCFFLIVALVYMLQPAGDPNTLEGLQQDFTNEINTVVNLVSSMLWFALSFVDWNKRNLKVADQKISDLTSRLEALEEQAITDIDEVNPNHFIARRRCGPDKDISRPDQEPTIEERIKDTNKRLAYFNATQKVLGEIPSGDTPIIVTPSTLRKLTHTAIEEYNK